VPGGLFGQPLSHSDLGKEPAPLALGAREFRFQAARFAEIQTLRQYGPFRRLFEQRRSEITQPSDLV